MKKEKEFKQKKSKKINKKTFSIDNISHTKINNYNKLINKHDKPNPNITHINNINIVNMIMNKEKNFKNRNISFNNRSQSNKKDNNKKDKQKRYNTSLLIDYTQKNNLSSLSDEDMEKFKTNKILNATLDYQKIPQIIKYKKKAGLLKQKQRNQSCRQLSNININLYNNNKFLNKKHTHKKNNISSRNLNDISSNKNNDFFNKIRRNINREESEENTNTINRTKNISMRKNFNKSTDDISYMKDLLEGLNLNKETENKEYIDSEMNFKNRLENDDYGKDLEFLNINIPYTIKVNLNKKRDGSNTKNASPKYLNTNNESIFNLNKSLYNTILLIKDNNINLEIKKTSNKYNNGKIKNYFFNNDEEIINFVKNKFKEKNSKYLSELQSKKYITNIFSNSNNKNKYKKKTNIYTGFTLCRKIKGQINFEIELNNSNLEYINNILSNENFDINNEFVIFIPIRNLNLLKEENKNIKWECNKLKEENKNLNLNVIKLKEDNTLLKIKYGKLKHECDNIIQELKIENYKIKEFGEKIYKKDIIIKKYEKKIKENQIEIKNLENKISLYKTNKNNNFIINNQIQIELIDKELKIFNKNIIQKENDNFETRGAIININNKNNTLKIEKLNDIRIISENLFKNNISKYAPNTNIMNNIILDKDILNQLNFKNIKDRNNINQSLIIDSIINLNYNGNKKFNNQILNFDKNKNIDLILERIEYFNYEGINNIKKYNKNYNISNNINFSYEVLKNKNKEMILEHINNIFYDRNKSKNKTNNILNITKEINISFEEIKKNFNLNIDKKVLNKFNIISIEKINSITFNNFNKIYKNNIYEFQQNILFSLISKKRNNIKKFDILEISKDILSNIFFEKTINISENDKDKEEFSLYEDIPETHKKSIIDKSTNNISTISNKTSNIKQVEKAEKSILKLSQKEEKENKALERIRRKNMAKSEKKSNNKPMNNNLFMSLQISGIRALNEDMKFRQSFKIMEIAKQLEKEIKKEEGGENKNKEILDGDEKYRNSNAIEIISNKPVDNKKKKKHKISFHD